MGRRRLPEDKKKVNLHLSISKELVDQLKENDINISKVAEELLQEYLKSNIEL